jgi:hypothetical protein
MNRSRSDSKNILVAVGLIALGLMFLLNIDALWPVFILVPGLIFMGAAIRGGRATAGLAIPGSIISGTAILLFVQNVSNYWESWAYAWTLYGVFLGFGFVTMANVLDDDRLAALGRSFMLFGLMAFAAFGFFFEVIIGLGGFVSGWWAWILIAAGIVILARSFLGDCGIPFLCPGGKHKRKGKNDDVLFTGPAVVGTRGRPSRHHHMDD